MSRDLFLLHTGTPVDAADAAANFDFAIGDLNGDGGADVFCLKKTNTGTGTLEVHVLSRSSNYQSFLVQTGTPIAAADAANFDFAIGDLNGDGRPDVFCLKKTNTGTGTLEVHVLSGSSNYQSLILDTATPIAAADAANFDFAIGDYNGDGRPDVFCLMKTNTGTGTLEIHVFTAQFYALVPKVIGEGLNEATSAIERAHLRAQVAAHAYPIPPSYDPLVLAQDPPDHTILPIGESVLLRIEEPLFIKLQIAPSTIAAGGTATLSWNVFNSHSDTTAFLAGKAVNPGGSDAAPSCDGPGACASCPARLE